MYKRGFFSLQPDQRKGVFALLVLIVVVQCIYFLVDFQKMPQSESAEFVTLKKQLDSLKNIEQEVKKDSIFAFNPNFITDYRGYVLGLTTEEIDRLHTFRKQGKFVHSASEFQQVTQVSDSLLAVISPYFKFPKWVKNTQKQKKSFDKTSVPTSKVPKKDLNTATDEDLMKVYGIGKVLSQRILKYKQRIQGFSEISQLKEVYGLEEEVVERIMLQFEIQTPPSIEKQDINTIGLYELAKIPYMDFDLAKKLIGLRSEVGNIRHFNDLLQIEGFDEVKIKRIQLYLQIHD
ncbi:ComEA family DNA-binding protein [Capnocytophaga canimorsus]|uniref:ComEA family DNA-binding protein n=1 Tax=Capnocytophaga canimorsus TaxID=28188 RepID=UPI0037D209AC